IFTVPFVPTGMNAGDGTSPCAVWRTPARAAPSVAVTVKWTGASGRSCTARPALNSLIGNILPLARQKAGNSVNVTFLRQFCPLYARPNATDALWYLEVPVTTGA